MVVSACGGGGGAGSTPPSTAFVGTITGFGSIFVNGVEFETNGSSISVDGESASEDDLKLGMQVTVVGSANGTTGNATAISFNDDLEGLVISNSISGGQAIGSMDIMGQTVNVTATTVFESKVAGVSGPDQITAGMIVEVSGFSSGMGNIQATRIEVKGVDLDSYLVIHPNGIEVKGIVANHDEQNMKLDIGSMTVDYSAAILDDLPAGSFDGLYVEVKSTAGIDSITGELIASKVELESQGDMGHDGDDNDEMEIRGQITSAIDGNSFAVDGQIIIVNNNTEYENIARSALLADVMVKVEGHYLNGDFIAEEVEAENESSNEISDVVAAVDTTATNTGTVTLQNATVITITNETLMKDSREDGFVPEQKFNLQSLSQGDYVEIHYYDKNGTLIATKLEREDM
jgi:hypothetical protein